MTHDQPRARQDDHASVPLRLLMVSSDTYPPTRVDVAVMFGVELAARGHRTDLILQSEATCPKSYVTAWGGGRVWVGATDLGSSLLSRIHKHIRGILADMKLFSWMRSGSYDIIIIKDKFLSGIMALLAATLFKKRCVYWLSYPFPESYMERARDGTARYPLLYLIRGRTFNLLLYKVLLPAADHVFVQSEQMRRDVAALGISAAKMTVVPMGVQAKMFPGAVNRAGRRMLPADVPCIVYLGTLARIRRLDFLLRVLLQVLQVKPAAKLYLVGRGDEPGDEQFLLEQARALGVEQALVLTGQLPQSEALQFVAEADVCVSPFRPTPVLNSTSPTKLIEYMAMGKAVVANDHPEQRSLIAASGAGLCVPYEEHGFAAAVLQLLDDRELAVQMGQRGRKYVLEHRSYRVIADKLEQELSQIAHGLYASNEQ
jgi:glycosyltransferase involved in cell wall biosynthesis